MIDATEATIETTDAIVRLWPEDTGLLAEGSRRALLELIKGPYLSGRTSPGLWSALLSDERAIISRLHELFLELVIDRIGEFAFVRNVTTDELSTPATVRTASLTFIDTAMLLVLRHMLLVGEGDGRVIVGRDEVFEQLRVYRTADRDEHDFDKRLNAAWQKMRNVLRVVHAAGQADREEDRVEISPVLRMVLDAEQVQAIGFEYARIASGDAALANTNADAPEGNNEGFLP